MSYNVDYVIAGKGSRSEEGFTDELCITDDAPNLGPVIVQNLFTSKVRTIRNAAIIGISQYFMFSGFSSLSNLQSTMNASEGMGVDSLALIYFYSMISCFFPDYFIAKFGTKSTYIMALVLSMPYIASNLDLHWTTMIISSVCFGLASGPKHAAVNCYLDELSIRYAKSSKESLENIKSFIFGFYMFFTAFAKVSGNVIAYYTLQVERLPQPVYQNFSFNTRCGVYFNPETANGTNSNLEPPSDFERHLLVGSFSLMIVLGLFISLFLDPLGNDVIRVEGCYSVTRKISSAIRLLKNPHQLLLLPITISMGIQTAFYDADFSQAFITCSLGVHNVGFVTICLGVCGSLMAIFVGPLVKWFSQMSVILLAAILNLISFILLFLWIPPPEITPAYFAFAGVWGMTEAIWLTQIGALYGLMFPNDREAAFSNFFFWYFLGSFISYSYANYFTVVTKIFIMLVFLIVGTILYLIGQIKIKCFSPRSDYLTIENS